MAVPKKRKSSRKGKLHRTGAYKLAAQPLSICSNCKALKRPHSVCKNCGYYNGKKIIDVKSKVKRKKKDDKENE